MSIRTALGGLPSWPALVIAPLVVLGVGALYYGPTYRQCTQLAEARADLTAAVARAAGGAVLRLEAAVAAPDWDQVRILPSMKVEGPVLDCPFGWDLARAERLAMLADGRLGILAFARAGEVVDYIEYRSDRIEFAGAARVLGRGEAVFSVAAPAAAGGAYILRLAGAKS